jgi:hypothetical protein
MQVSYLAYSALKMEAACSSDTSLYFKPTLYVICKETVVPYLKGLSRQLTGEPEEDSGRLSEKVGCPVRVLNWSSLEYK